MSSYDLASRLEGTGVTINVLHPGGVQNDFFGNGLFAKLLKLILLTPEQGGTDIDLSRNLATDCCPTSGGQQSSSVCWKSHAQVSSTGFVKGWCRHVSSMSPCTAGSCGPTKWSRNAFDSTISVRLATISVIAGLRRHLPSNPNGDIIQANHERKKRWQPFKDSKRLPGVVD
jgi:hypothetical protein